MQWNWKTKKERGACHRCGKPTSTGNHANCKPKVKKVATAPKLAVV